MPPCGDTDVDVFRTGHFDHGAAWNIGSLQALVDARDQFAAGGVELWPWGVPMGLDAYGNTAVDADGVEAEARARSHTDKRVFHIIATDPSQFGAMLDWQSAVEATNVAVWLADSMNKPLYDPLASHDFGSGPIQAGAASRRCVCAE